MNEAEIVAWLVREVATTIGASESSIDPDGPIEDVPIDSVEGVVLTGDLSDWLGVDVDPSIAWAHPTLRHLARELATGPGGA